MQTINLIFSLAILIMSIVVHEVSHGLTANALGDPTARLAGRLTLNPIRHMDPVGSILVPLITYAAGGFIIGWANPVPYNPYNLRYGHGSAIVAFAGPASNILLALAAGLALRFGFMHPLLGQMVLINLALAVFNLTPIPPLDGSKVLLSVLPYRMRRVEDFLVANQFLLLIFFMFFLWRYMYWIVDFMARAIIGI